MWLYIAGPMRGYEENNFPAFINAAKKYRKLGFDVVSPAEMDLVDNPDAAKQTEAEAVGNFDKYMSRDLPAVCGCNGVVLLDGWENSTGALAEAFVALSCKKLLIRDHSHTSHKQYDIVDPIVVIDAIVAKYGAHTHE